MVVPDEEREGTGRTKQSRDANGMWRVIPGLGNRLVWRWRSWPVEMLLDRVAQCSSTSSRTHHRRNGIARKIRASVLEPAIWPSAARF